MRSSYETVVSTRRHPAHPVSVPILPPREIQALWSQNHDTEILHTNVVSRVGNGMTCRRTGYDRYGILMLRGITPDALTEKNVRDKETTEKIKQEK